MGRLTDNIGNRFVLARMFTTKWPLVAFLSEMSAQLEARNIMFELSGASREQNAEADAITNGDLGWLSAGKQVATKMSELPFIILPEMLSQGEAFYAGNEVANSGVIESAKRDQFTLRVRDPWD